MALTYNGTRVDIASSDLPTGYSKPSVTTFTDFEGQYKQVSFTIAKSSVENATATTTMANIITALNTAADAYLSADLDTTNTITAYGIAKTITMNTDDADDERFTTTATSADLDYVVVVDLFFKTS